MSRPHHKAVSLPRLDHIDGNPERIPRFKKFANNQTRWVLKTRRVSAQVSSSVPPGKAPTHCLLRQQKHDHQLIGEQSQQRWTLCHNARPDGRSHPPTPRGAGFASACLGPFRQGACPEQSRRVRGLRDSPHHAKTVAAVAGDGVVEAAIRRTGVPGTVEPATTTKHPARTR